MSKQLKFDFVKVTFNSVERILVRLVALDKVASTLLLVWTGLNGNVIGYITKLLYVESG